MATQLVGDHFNSSELAARRMAITAHMDLSRVQGEEGIGFLTSDGVWHPMRNDSSRPGDTWEVSRAQADAWSRCNPANVVAIVHSHPCGSVVPSQVDLGTAEMLESIGVEFFLWVYADGWKVYQYWANGESRLIHTLQ